MRTFPRDYPESRETYFNGYCKKNGSGTLTGCGHSYGMHTGDGFGRGIGNYPYQLIQYWP